MTCKFDLSKKTKGQALVEFALILPLLLLLILGMIEFGWLLNGKLVITSAAREGARAGIVIENSDEREERINDIVDSIVENSGVTINNIVVSLVGNDIVVELSGEMEPIIGFFFDDDEVIEMSSKAIMRKE